MRAANIWEKLESSALGHAVWPLGKMTTKWQLFLTTWQESCVLGDNGGVGRNWEILTVSLSQRWWPKEQRVGSHDREQTSWLEGNSRCCLLSLWRGTLRIYKISSLWEGLLLLFRRCGSQWCLVLNLISAIFLFFSSILLFFSSLLFSLIFFTSLPCFFPPSLSLSLSFPFFILELLGAIEYKKHNPYFKRVTI